MTVRFRPVLALCALSAVLILATGCGGSSAPSGQAGATDAQNQVTPAVRALYQRIYGAHTGWATGLSGQYEKCLTSSNQDELDYHGIVYYLYPFNRSITAAAYTQDIVKSAQADGWTFKKHIDGSRDGNLFPEQMEKGSLDGHIAVSTAPSSKISHVSAVIEIESTCFDAGSAASSLSQHSSQSSLPHPNPVPTG